MSASELVTYGVFDDGLSVYINDSDISSGGNFTGSLCTTDVPKAQHLFRAAWLWNVVVLGVSTLLAGATLLIYVEEVVYVMCHFENYRRRTKTIWVLALYPVYSVTALIGTFVPRAGTLVDLVGNVYFSTCLYQFVRLMVDYAGGPEHMLAAVGAAPVSLRSPPCCCCCLCLPDLTFGQDVYRKLNLLVMQYTIVRPCLMFIAAVLWSNDNYQAGVIAHDNGFIYIMVLNLTSTFTAVYGLLLIQRTFKVVEELESYHLRGKFLSLQMVLILTVTFNIIVNAAVNFGFIPCNHILPSKTRGERIYHCILITLMLPLSLLGRRFYRRKEEGKKHPHYTTEHLLKPVQTREIMTSTMSLNSHHHHQSNNNMDQV